MTFVEMRDRLIKHFNEMTADNTPLFTINLDKDELWETYLNSFTDEQNPIFRVRREYDCSCCRHFIKQTGNVVTIKDGVIETIWDILGAGSDPDYGRMLYNMAEYVRQRAITGCIENVFLSREAKIGVHNNFALYDNGERYRFDHFYLELPERFVVKNSSEQSAAVIRNARLCDYKTGKEAFKRALEEITMDALDTVIDLCESNNLYQGDTYYKMVKAFREYKNAYLVAFEHHGSTELFAWENSVKAGYDVCRIRNRAIGTLLVDLSEGMDVETAVGRYEVVVAPTNYRRPKPIFTKKMLEDAKKTISELGYLDSLPRRFAKLDDISVNDVLFADRDSVERMKDDDVFDILSGMTSVKPVGKAQNFDSAPKMTVEEFINDILPTARNIEAYVENKHARNLVSLIAPVNGESKSMFKWGNSFSWAYAGNLADSDMKERVKAAGGSVTGDLRFSIQWNEDGHDNCDLDAHCVEANGQEIYFRTYRAPHVSMNGGQLDVDIIHPDGKIAVENITFEDRKNMKPGYYVFGVHQYSGSASRGFRAEVEYDGRIFKYDYNMHMKTGDMIVVAKVYLDINGAFTIEHVIPEESESARTIWNVPTNKFVPVSAVCYSPNYWSACKNPCGHKHLMFMLKDCISDENPGGIFNEYLVSDLYNHRKVMEALSGQMRVESTNDQLSGLGFALDRRAELVVKVVSDTDTKVYRIKF